MTGFAPDPRLASSSTRLGNLTLCEVRLQDDGRWPWLVLIPRRPGLRELEALAEPDRARLMEEAVLAGRAVRAVGAQIGFAVEKLNVGALGNVVPQLHLHVVGRQPGDPAWPAPVWGVGKPCAYAPTERVAAKAAARRALGAALTP